MIDRGDVFVDKTLLIKELLEDPRQVIILPRPARFGKSINLDMVKKFLNIEIAPFTHVLQPKENRTYYKLFAEGVVENKPLRRKLKISEQTEFLSKYQGQFPVLYMDLGNVRVFDLRSINVSMANELAENFEDFLMGLDLEALNNTRKSLLFKYFTRIINQTDIEYSLRFFSDLLYERFSRKSYLLVDGYSSPLYESAKKFGFQSFQYKYIKTMLENMFAKVLVNNPYLEKAIITGVLPIEEANFFSFLDASAWSLGLDDLTYSKFYGFSEEEVDRLLKMVPTKTDPNAIKSWFNGYNYGELVVYNPRAVMLCLHRNGLIENYWSYSMCASSQVGRVLVSEKAQEEVKHLLLRKPVMKQVNKWYLLEDVESSEISFYSSLVAEGLLNAVPSGCTFEGKQMYHLVIPNEDARFLYLRSRKKFLNETVEKYDKSLWDPLFE